MTTESKVRKAVRKYLGKNHDFCAEIADDDWSEKIRFGDYASSAMDEAEIEDGLEDEDVNGDPFWHHAVNEVQRQFIIWLVKQHFTKDEIKKLF